MLPTPRSLPTLRLVPTLRTVAAAVALAAVVATSACSAAATDTPTAPAPASAASTAAGSADVTGGDSDKQAVEAAYTGYSEALLARDFAAACAALTPEARDKLPRDVAAQGLPDVQTCEDAFATVYGVPAAAAQLDEATKTLEISDITITGDDATVTYSGSVNGQRSPDLTNRLHREDGAWLLVANS